MKIVLSSVFRWKVTAILKHLDSIAHSSENPLERRSNYSKSFHSSFFKFHRHTLLWNVFFFCVKCAVYFGYFIIVCIIRHQNKIDYSCNRLVFLKSSHHIWPLRVDYEFWLTKISIKWNVHRHDFCECWFIFWGSRSFISQA